MTNVRAVLFVFLTMSASPASAAADISHLRMTDVTLAAAVASGINRSALFRELVDRINASDLIVHVVTDAALPHDIAGRLAFATRAGGYRYVRISIASRLRGCDLVVIIGHELRHAVEIADTPSLVDQRSMAAFYTEVGVRRAGPSRDTFDTTAAVEAGTRIRYEVAAFVNSDRGRVTR
jgi:hypothetical protein